MGNAGAFSHQKGPLLWKMHAGTALLGPKGRNGDGNRVNAFWFSNLVGKLPRGVKAEATRGSDKPWERSRFRGFAAKPLGGSRASKRQGQRESPQGSRAGGPAVRLPLAGSSQQGREEQPRARCGLADLTALGDAVPSLPLLPYLTTKPDLLPFKTRPIKCQARRGVKVADIRLCGDK